MVKRDMLNRYFIGVMDIEIKSGTVDNMEFVDKYRIFNEKFVNSPELALLIAFDEENERWKIDPYEIMKDVIYDEKAKEWKRTIFETTKGHRASEAQIEKWKRGEYELVLVTEYVQIMETELVEDSELVDKALDKWYDKLDKLVWKEELAEAKRHDCACGKCQCEKNEEK